MIKSILVEYSEERFQEVGKMVEISNVKLYGKIIHFYFIGDKYEKESFAMIVDRDSGEIKDIPCCRIKVVNFEEI